MLGLRVLLWQSDGLEEKALLPQYLVHGNDGPTSQTDFFVDSLLATLNLVRAEDLGIQEGQEPHVFSMASWKQCQCNERLLDLFMENLALDPTWVKNHSCYEELRTYGAIAA